MRYAVLACLAALAAAPAVQAATIGDYSFETVRLSNGAYQYSPSGTTWSFTGTSGIASNNSPWFSSPAPDGTQAAFLQIGASISEQVTGLTVGSTYAFSFYDTARVANAGNPVDVTIGGFDLGVFKPTLTTFTQVSTLPFTATATSELLAFTTPNGPADISTIIDDVTIAPTLASVPVPEPASLLLLAGGLIGAGLLRRRAA